MLLAPENGETVSEAAAKLLSYVKGNAGILNAQGDNMLPIATFTILKARELGKDTITDVIAQAQEIFDFIKKASKVSTLKLATAN